MCFLNFINKCFIIWLIIHNITIVKLLTYKYLIYCNKRLSWRFVGEVSEEPNSFISLAKRFFYMIIVIVLILTEWVKRNFPCVSPITNFIEIIVKLWCLIILILVNKKFQQGWDSIRQIIYVNQEKQRSQNWALWHSSLNFLPFRFLLIQNNSLKPIW